MARWRRCHAVPPVVAEATLLDAKLQVAIGTAVMSEEEGTSLPAWPSRSIAQPRTANGAISTPFGHARGAKPALHRPLRPAAIGTSVAAICGELTMKRRTYQPRR